MKPQKYFAMYRDSLLTAIFVLGLGRLLVWLSGVDDTPELRQGLLMVAAMAGGGALIAHAVSSGLPRD